MKKWMQYTGENTPESYGELFDGPALRDQGIKQVMSNNENWMEKALGYAKRFVTQETGRMPTFTGEDLRFWCALNIGNPKHPNAWGALINTLIQRKIIEPTGEHRPMKDRVSHARSTPVYRAL